MKKLTRFLFLSLPVIPVGFAAVKISLNDPPLAEMADTQKMLAQAKLRGSESFGGVDYEMALLYYDSAMASWKAENERFILFRDFDRVRELAGRSGVYAERSISNAIQDRLQVRKELERKQTEIGHDLERFVTLYGAFPYETVSNGRLVGARLQYMEGLQAFGNGNWTDAGTRFDSASRVIEHLHRDYEALIREYFRDYQEWQKWEQQTVAFSRKNRTSCIIVDKIDRKCTLYRNGKEVNAFTVELGPNWMGDKTRQGDRSTPEGLYRVTGRKSGGETRFHKALLLDYPNEADKKRFELNRKNGVIAGDAEIGGLIEIHGNGGKGVDWTDGCVALKDPEMDILFDACPVGTRVTIVGSSRPLEQFYSGENEHDR